MARTPNWPTFAPPTGRLLRAVDTKSVDFGGQQGKFRLMEKLCIKDWPGKTFEGSSPDTHPALWHMLDVAAVAGGAAGAEVADGQ